MLIGIIVPVGARTTAFVPRVLGDATATLVSLRLGAPLLYAVLGGMPLGLALGSCTAFGVAVFLGATFVGAPLRCAPLRHPMLVGAALGSATLGSATFGDVAVFGAALGSAALTVTLVARVMG